MNAVTVEAWMALSAAGTYPTPTLIHTIRLVSSVAACLPYVGTLASLPFSKTDPVHRRSSFLTLIFHKVV